MNLQCDQLLACCTLRQQHTQNIASFLSSFLKRTAETYLNKYVGRRGTQSQPAIKMGINLLARSSSQDKHFNSCFLLRKVQQIVQGGGDYNLFT